LASVAQPYIAQELHSVILLLSTDVSFGSLCGVYSSQFTYLPPSMSIVLYRAIHLSH